MRIPKALRQLILAYFESHRIYCLKKKVHTELRLRYLTQHVYKLFWTIQLTFN